MMQCFTQTNQSDFSVVQTFDDFHNEITTSTHTTNHEDLDKIVTTIAFDAFGARGGFLVGWVT
jgi:hypothetical protein